MGLIDFLKKIAQSTSKKETVTPEPSTQNKDEPCIYNRRVKVKGSTFDNDDGSSRQEILRQIYQHKPPFDKRLDVLFEEFEFDGKPAYYVKVNGSCVGTVETEIAEFISKNKTRILEIVDFKVDWFTPEEEDGAKRIYYAKAKISVMAKK